MLKCHRTRTESSIASTLLIVLIISGLDTSLWPLFFFSFHYYYYYYFFWGWWWWFLWVILPCWWSQSNHFAFVRHNRVEAAAWSWGTAATSPPPGSCLRRGRPLSDTPPDCTWPESPVVEGGCGSPSSIPVPPAWSSDSAPGPRLPPHPPIRLSEEQRPWPKHWVRLEPDVLSETKWRRGGSGPWLPQHLLPQRETSTWITPAFAAQRTHSLLLVSSWLIFMCIASFVDSVMQFCLNMGVVSSQHRRNALGTFDCSGHCLGWT